VVAAFFPSVKRGREADLVSTDDEVLKVYIDTKVLFLLHLSPLVEVTTQPGPDHFLHHLDAALLASLCLLICIACIFLFKGFDLR